MAHTFPFLPPLAAPTPTEKNLGKDPLAQGRRAGVGRGRGSAVVPPTLSMLGQVELRRGDGVEWGGVCGTVEESVPPACRLWVEDGAGGGRFRVTGLWWCQGRRGP